MSRERRFIRPSFIGPSIQQIDQVENREGHRVIDHAIAIEISDNVARRRRRQINQQVRRHRTEVSANTEWYITTDEKDRAVSAIHVAQVAVIVVPHAIVVSGSELVRRQRPHGRGSAWIRTRTGLKSGSAGIRPWRWYWLNRGPT